MKSEKEVSSEIELFNQAVAQVGKETSKLVDAIYKAFTSIWEDVKKSFNNFEFLDTVTFSRKKFIKLLMSIGYQRNEANKIAIEYNKKHQKYTLGDYLTEQKKKEDSKCG